MKYSQGVPQQPLPKQPFEPSGLVRRWWKGLSPLARLSLLLLGSLLLTAVACFWLTVNRIGSAVAFEILLGLTSPIGTRTGSPGIALAIVGYLAVPILTGAFVSLWLEFSLQRLSRRFREQVEAMERLAEDGH